jgi:hypothetical protein
MAQIKLLPPLAHLQACFIYKTETGDLIWRTRPRQHFAHARSWSRHNTQFAGNVAGNIDIEGYRIILLNRVPYKSHRIAWKLVTGEEPPETIDHINGNRIDNRWANLRAATRDQQLGNQHLHRTNTSGYRGVSPHLSGKWVARVSRRHLGLFATPEAAYEAYKAAAREHFGDFFNPR